MAAFLTTVAVSSFSVKDVNTSQDENTAIVVIVLVTADCAAAAGREGGRRPHPQVSLLPLPATGPAGAGARPGP